MKNRVLSLISREGTMKISSLGPNEIPQRRAQDAAVSPAARGDGSSAQRSASRGAQTSTRIFTEALVIAHTAKSIVSRAMEIASQLQGLAARTLSSGSVDQAEIARVVSAANAVMSETNGQPASAVIVPQVNGTLRENRIVDYASVRESLASVKTQALHMQEGGLPDLGKIRSAFETLKRAGESIESVHREFQAAPGAQTIVNIEESGRARAVIERTTAAISSAQKEALAIQGNIHPERARDLLG